MGKSNHNLWGKGTVATALWAVSQYEKQRRGTGHRPVATTSVSYLWPGMAFDQNHVCPGCAVPHLARFAVLFAVEPFPGAVR
jgi:hypothetical protein